MRPDDACFFLGQVPGKGPGLVLVIGIHDACISDMKKNGHSRTFNLPLFHPSLPLVFLHYEPTQAGLLKIMNDYASPAGHQVSLERADTADSMAGTLLDELADAFALYPDWRPGLAARLAGQVEAVRAARRRPT